MYTGSEDGAIKIWDLRAPSCQRNYDVGSAVNTVALHPNQAELISGDMDGKVKVGSVRNDCGPKSKLVLSNGPIYRKFARVNVVNGK